MKYYLNWEDYVPKQGKKYYSDKKFCEIIDKGMWPGKECKL